MGLGLQSAFGNAAQSDKLEQILKEAYLKALTAKKLQDEQAARDEEVRRFNVSAGMQQSQLTLAQEKAARDAALSNLDLHQGDTADLGDMKNLAGSGGFGALGPPPIMLPIFKSLPSIHVPGIGGVGETDVTPKSAQELRAAKLREEADKVYNVPAGGFAGNASGSIRIDGPVKEPTQKSLQGDEYLVNGKPKRLNYDPGDGVYKDPDTGAIVPSSQVHKLPPAKDPLVTALAQERLDAAKRANKPLDITLDVRSTRSGQKWIDPSNYKTDEIDKLREAAAALGVKVVTKAEASHLKNIETARLNQAALMQDIQDSLPKDAAGRVLAAPGILLSKALQTEDALAAYGSWRQSAIQTLQALVGGAGSGLRINQAEIAQSLQNDIPKLTDTIETAQHKLANLQKQFDNAEAGILGSSSQQNDPFGIRKK